MKTGVSVNTGHGLHTRVAELEKENKELRAQLDAALTEENSLRLRLERAVEGATEWRQRAEQAEADAREYLDSAHQCELLLAQSDKRAEQADADAREISFALETLLEFHHLRSASPIRFTEETIVRIEAARDVAAKYLEAK